MRRFIDDVLLRGKPCHRGIKHMSEDEYRANPGLNPSSIAAGIMSDGDVDPVLIKREYEGVPRKTAAAQQDRMDRGTLGHLAILQPELVDHRVAVWRGDRRAGNVWDKFVNDSGSRLMIRQDDYDEVMRAAEACLAVSQVREIFSGCTVETAFFGESEGMATRGRVDAFKSGDIHVIADLKFTEAGIDHKSVMNTIRQFKYREKMAMYRRLYCQATGVEPELVKCFNVFVRLPPPAAVRIMKFTTGALEFGEYRIDKALKRVRECIETGNWPTFVADDLADAELWETPDEEVIEIDY